MKITALMGIADGNRGIRQTLRLMRKVVKNALSNPVELLVLRDKALEITRGIPEKNKELEIRALHRFVRDQIRYVNDITGIETVQTPTKTLAVEAGDCDDKSVLLVTLLFMVGLEGRFCAVGFNKHELIHVLPQVYYQGKWVSLEVTEKVHPGWHPPQVQCEMIQEI